MSKIINDQNFDAIAAEGLPLIIDFSATWCGPCQRLAPIIDELSEEYAGRANVCKCDIDESEDLAVRFGIRSVPTVVFIKNGEVVNRKVGAAKKSDFAEAFDEFLK